LEQFPTAIVAGFFKCRFRTFDVLRGRFRGKAAI